MISFAQNREDVLIDRVFRKSTGFFIDVGAFQPVADSVTKYFSLAGWRGINIEPAPEGFAALARDRPNDTNLHCAVGRTRGVTQFHQLPMRAMSTTSDTHLAQLQTEYRAGELCFEVEVRTLADICTEYVQGNIDFLKIDTEGSESDVIFGADWKRFRPRLVVIEATKPWTSEPNCAEWEPFLLSQDYSLQHQDGINRYYLRREDEDLAVQLSLPVNVLDCYISYRELQLHEEVQRLNARLGALTISS